MLFSSSPSLASGTYWRERRARESGIGCAVSHVGMEKHSEVLMELGVARAGPRVREKMPGLSCSCLSYPCRSRCSMILSLSSKPALGKVPCPGNLQLLPKLGVVRLSPLAKLLCSRWRTALFQVEKGPEILSPCGKCFRRQFLPS